jgi:hypothetical protein
LRYPEPLPTNANATTKLRRVTAHNLSPSLLHRGWHFTKHGRRAQANRLRPTT